MVQIVAGLIVAGFVVTLFVAILALLGFIDPRAR